VLTSKRRISKILDADIVKDCATHISLNQILLEEKVKNIKTDKFLRASARTSKLTRGLISNNAGTIKIC